jgi:hypothetical protein|tara:strand:- start:13393 stop:13734 length:342 start_codon:yes stop_codon:yes gene_type:complete
MKLSQKNNIDYKFNEGALIKELQSYIDKTYDGHYSKNKFQSTEFIVDCGHGIGFAIGNILKYAQRYGRKGTSEDHRKDLMKVLHYGIIALSIHDKETVQHYLDEDLKRVSKRK